MPKWYAWLWMPGTLCRGLVRGTTLPVWIPLAEVVGWILFAIFAIWWFVAERVALRTTKADRNFSDRPLGLKEFPLEVVILRDDAEVGMDRGLAWFENGLFYFNGSATSFALAGTDFVRKNKLRLDMSDDPKDYIGLKNPRVQAALRLVPIGGWNCFRFRHRFDRFLSEPPARTAIRQWPPIVAYEREDAQISVRSSEEVGTEAVRNGSASNVVQS